MKKSFVLSVLAVLWGAAGVAEAGQVYNLTISYSGQNTSGTAYLQGLDVGRGEFNLIGGYLNSTDLGYETLVVSPDNPNVVTLRDIDGHGANVTYDNRVFVPAGAPNGANLTYEGGIAFQTPSKSSGIYFSAANAGSNDPAIYYFAGYDRPDGKLGSFVVTVSTPEPATIIPGSLGALIVLSFGLVRRRKRASV